MTFLLSLNGPCPYCLGGGWPTKRHDETPWNDTDKARKTPRKMLKAVLVETRQDWKFAAEVFGFPTHRSDGGICWKCHCTSAEVTRALCNQFPHTNTFAGAKAPPYAGAKAPPRNVGAHVEIEKHKARRSFSLVSLGKTLCFFLYIFSLGETSFFCSTLEKSAYQYWGLLV